MSKERPAPVSVAGESLIINASIVEGGSRKLTKQRKPELPVNCSFASYQGRLLERPAVAGSSRPSSSSVPNMGEIVLPRRMFLWCMAVLYLIAFVSLYMQIPGKTTFWGEDKIDVL